MSISVFGTHTKASKCKTGGQKMLVEEIEVTPKNSKKMDKFEDGSDEDGYRSDSPTVERSEEGKH